MRVSEILFWFCVIFGLGVVFVLAFNLGHWDAREGTNNPTPGEQQEPVAVAEPKPEVETRPACNPDAVICMYEVVEKEQPKPTASKLAGKASWYAKGLINPYSEATAASRDFPRGSRLLVSNPDNGKSVEVRVNDYGPSFAIHPDRIIDLSAFAFQQLAPLNQGVLFVTVTPI